MILIIKWPSSSDDNVDKYLNGNDQTYQITDVCNCDYYYGFY